MYICLFGAYKIFMELDFSFFDFFLLSLVGLISGFLNVLAGGGSLLTMPAMIMMGMPGAVANGTNRIGLITQNIFAISGFFRKGFSDFRLSLTLSLCALPGVLAGAYMGTKLSGVLFNRVLAAVMVMVMIIMASGKKKTATTPLPAKSKTRTSVTHMLMLAVGFYMGIIQAGVGFIVMAILNKVLGLDLVKVNMHKVFIIGFSMVPSLIIFAWHGKVLWLAGFVLAAGNGAGGWIGAHVAVKKGERFIKIFLYITLAALAAKLAFFS